MREFKKLVPDVKIILGAAVFLLAAAGLFVAFIGPWPVYKNSGFATSAYCRKALADIDKSIALSDFTATPGSLQAGWGAAKMTPKVGTVMRGVMDPDGSRIATAVRDDLYSKAICLSDGKDTVALIGTDILMVTSNIAEMARRKIAAQVGLPAKNILFSASHTQTGPGAFAPGLFWTVGFGKLDPVVTEQVSTAMADAVVAAYRSMAPARLADCHVDAPEFIFNYMHNAATDSMLKFLVVEKLTGEKCFVIRYSAHPSNFERYPDCQKRISAEYPGALQRCVEAETKGMAIYVAGATGCMLPKPPKAPGPDERVELMGRELAKKMLDSLAASPPQFKTNLDIASMGVPIGMPSTELRMVSPAFRASPLLLGFVGIRAEGWIQSIRVGDILFIGLPFDVSGEIARQWCGEVAPKGWDLWLDGFSGAYCGYLSPDKYYFVDGLTYESGTMGWTGPDAEAYMRTLRDKIVAKMGELSLRAQNGAPT